MCEGGFYGTNCSKPCGHCNSGAYCNIVTGNCPNGCQSHWSGSRCDGKLTEYNIVPSRRIMFRIINSNILLLVFHVCQLVKNSWNYFSLYLTIHTLLHCTSSCLDIMNVCWAVSANRRNIRSHILIKTLFSKNNLNTKWI